MKERACIYCGVTDNLSASDIIPDALTNAKVLNRCVCQIEHNNRFSDLFESDVIKKLAFITNQLDVKSSKGKGFLKYDATIIVEGKEYSTSISSDADLLNSNRIITSVDGTSKIGPIDKLKKIKTVALGEISEINIDGAVEERIPINIDVFFSNSMYRLASKIAYEWYCLCNDISGKLNQFDDIIDYICTGHGNNPVSIVSNPELYKLFEDLADFGSHILITYIGTDGSVNAIISLFGIAIYNVRLLNNRITECKNNVNFLKLTLDSKRDSFSYEDINELRNCFFTSFNRNKAGKHQIMTPINANDTSLQYQFLYISCYSRFQSELNLTVSNDKELIDLIINNINKAISISIITKKSIKRFVKDHQKIIANIDTLDLHAINAKTLLYLYFLFLIGNPKNTIKSFNDFNTYIKRKETSDKVQVNFEKTEYLRTNMMNSEYCFSYIKDGAITVNDW